MTVKMSAGNAFLRVGVCMLGLCLASGSGFAQDAAGKVAYQPDETSSSKSDASSFSVSGTVINSVTGEPIRRAAVQVSGQNGGMAITDQGGHFVIDGLAEGNAVLSAMKPGFFDEGTHATARVGKDAPAVVLKLTPSGVISGRVSTRDERPLEGFQIRVMSKQNVEGRIVWMDQPNRAGTNEEGEFRIAGLQPGTYYIAVEQSSEPVLSQTNVPNAREQVFARIFHPGVSDLSAATPIEVAPGREVEVNFTLMPEPLYQVSGTVGGAGVNGEGLTFARRAGEDSDFIQTVEVQGGKYS